jgi:carbonic anhydrase/acetyltransferase-like protein (isoleucine patch superfamily)
MIYDFEGHRPELCGDGIFIAPGAHVIGKVTLHEDVSIWFNATLRGDLEPISIGRGSNIQDGSTVHTDRGLPTTIGENVTVGHNCVIHGCSVGDGSLIGMGSTILSGARIGRNCLVGAGSLVTGSMNVPDGMLVMGSPAKIVKPLTEGVIAKSLSNSANYVQNKNRYLKDGYTSGAEDSR